jgi:Mrp family chromosome partitioning ATPase
MSHDSTIPTLDERLRRVGHICRRRLWLIVATVVVAVVAAVLVASSATRQYAATAKVVLDDSELVGVPASVARIPNPDPQRDINTKVALITSAPVARAVESQLHLSLPLATLLTKVQAQPEGTSNIVDVTVMDTNAARAQAMADAFVNQYGTYRRAVARSSLAQTAADLRRQLAALGPRSSTTPQGVALTGQLRELTFDLAATTGGAEMVSLAGAATGNSRSLASAALIGAVAGLALALTLVAVLELIDRRLKDEDDVVSSSSVRVLSAIPHARRGRRGSVLADGGPWQARAYDGLASQLVLAKRREMLTSVIVTSPGWRDGRTTVTVGLARALARLERRVLIVETDPRTSLVSGGPEETAVHGLAAVVTGTSPLANEVVPLAQVPSESSSDGDGLAAISVLPFGPANLPLQRVLSAPEIAESLAAATRMVDFVLVDGPPTQSLHHALSLVDATDAALVVARLRWTRRDSLDLAIETLDALAVRVLGLVLTDTSKREFVPSQGHKATVVPVSANGQRVTTERRLVAPPRSSSWQR